MKRHILFLFIFAVILFECATIKSHSRDDVALSFDTERIAYEIVGKEKMTVV